MKKNPADYFPETKQQLSSILEREGEKKGKGRGQEGRGEREVGKEGGREEKLFNIFHYQETADMLKIFALLQCQKVFCTLYIESTTCGK